MVTLGLPGFVYADLYTPDGLARLAAAFHDFVRSRDASLADAWRDHRAAPERAGARDVSSLLIRMAIPLGRFLATLFRIEAAWEEMLRKTREIDPISPQRRKPRIDMNALVPFIRPRPHDAPELLAGTEAAIRLRDGFSLTDPRMSLQEALDQAHYCILCHEREKDSCARGLPLPRREQPVRTNALGIPLAGCPLNERISEAHLLKRGGDSIAALAVVMIDNPLCPGTGHRICNDCMKSCIFQKQEPVDVPQIESRILTDVLELPYGFEIYSLLTRWNPLHVRRPHALPYNGVDILVVGLGPAGYTLSHYLLNEGFGVVAIDGLKIEPLPEDLVGDGERPPDPLRDVADIRRPLDTRAPGGFGGVAEYGITVRWDKNFLTLLHLTLARRRTFRAYGGTRFGGTLTLDDAWALGLRHVAIAAGAGRPTLVPMKNGLLRGIRTASDFLMALQLSGAFRREALASLQVELPAVVIGGGLTAVDTATELLAYYPIQVERMLDRYESLAGRQGQEAARAGFDDEEREILDRYLDHGRAIRAERARARRHGETPNFVPLLDRWGGVTIAYRKSLVDSPAYRLNHEEVEKSLEEGVRFAERLSPIEAVPDAQGHVRAVRFERQRSEAGRWVGSAEDILLPARCVCMAAGTSPNVVYEREHPGTFEMNRTKGCFQGHRVREGVDGCLRTEPASQTAEDPGFFTSYARAGRFVSYFGDNHPAFAGSVVKAMASAKRGYSEIAALFRRELDSQSPGGQMERDARWKAAVRRLDEVLRPRVVDVRRLTPSAVEVVVRAPAQARNFRPGQFFRLQNYEAHAPRVGGISLTLEGIAATGAWVDPGAGLVGLILLESGASTRLCRFLRPGEPVVLMGPTGAPTEIPAGENVILAGGGLGNAVLLSIAQALRQRSNRVLYFAGYRSAEDLFRREDIEGSSDQVVWSVDRGDLISARRSSDRTFRGNIVQAMTALAEGRLDPPVFSWSQADRIIAIGGDRMMAAVCRARREGLAPRLNPDHVAVASINSPMQCMMKEICGQCLQQHRDPATGGETPAVFSCYNQDQPMDAVDWDNLRQRLRQNTVQEKLTDRWLDDLLRRHGLTGAPPPDAGGVVAEAR